MIYLYFNLFYRCSKWKY